MRAIDRTKRDVVEKSEAISALPFPLNQIYFYLTAGCNLACRHCWLSPKHQNENKKYPVLPVNRFRTIIEQAIPLGLNRIKLTGGEPLMHPDILELIMTAKILDVSLSVETNGVLCTPRIAEELATCKNISVSVSLDGAKAETHEAIRGVDGCFTGALKGIKTLTDAGIKPKIIFTVMRHNKDQLEAVIRIAEVVGATLVKFNIVQPTGRGKNMNDHKETLAVEELIKLGEWIKNTLSKSTNVGIYFSLPAAFKKMSDMYGKKDRGCARCGLLNIIGVLADGSYALCGIGHHTPELVFGDSTVDRLEDVWRNNAVLNQLREGLPARLEGICGNCHMKRVCVGSCIAQNYYRTGSLWKPYWFCEEAYSKGLFPASRIMPKPFR
jgi:SynChlorMet cassette radical SAM/SPASM protein ScmF